MLMSDGSIVRYKFVQRVGHAINAIAFFTLLITGLFLFFSPFFALGSHASRIIHRIAAVFLFLGPIMYFLTDPKDILHLLKASFTYNKNDVIWLIKMPFYFIGLAEGLPPQGEINAGQRLHHAATVIFYNLIALSGIALWIGSARLGQELFLWMLMLHDVSMVILTVLMIGHMYFSFVYGAVNNMITGRISAAYAQIEHPLWVEELKQEKVKEVEAK